MGKPNIASLSLNLDGCRFGNEFRHTRQQTTEITKQQQFDSKQQQQNKLNSNQIENSHPNQPDIQLGSPLSTHHYNHQPQYTTLPSHHPSHQNLEQPPSPLGNTYRHEGLSIGINFLRCNGINNGTLCIDDLIIEDCVGRGVCSSVWKARRKTHSTNSCIGGNNRNVEDVVDGIQSIELEDNKKKSNNAQNIELQQSSAPPITTTTYALKVFPLHNPTKRSMLIRELKLLCTFKCDCLVELEGAFLDNVNGNGNGGYGNNVTLVLEYMDCGSLVDLMSSRSNNVVDVGNIIGSPNQQDVKTTATLPTTPGTPLFCNLSPPTSDNGKHRKVPEYAVAAIAYQILWGLCYLHYEGVLHRDIKVSNILVRCLELSG